MKTLLDKTKFEVKHSKQVEGKFQFQSELSDNEAESCFCYMMNEMTNIALLEIFKRCKKTQFDKEWV